MGFAIHQSALDDESEGLTPMGIDFVIFYTRSALVDFIMEVLSLVLRSYSFFRVCAPTHHLPFPPLFFSFC